MLTLRSCCGLAPLLAASVHVAAARPQGPPKTPGEALNLTGWQLQTCLQQPRVVSGAALRSYTDRNFFLSTDGSAAVMLTPDNDSAVTTHSSHPRTEFRETGVADWALDKGEHVLLLGTAVLRVSNTTQETIIMQIHGSVDEEIAKVLKLRWTGGRVEARVKKKTAPYDEIGLDCGQYHLGQLLTVQVRVATGVLHVAVNGKEVSYVPPYNSSDRYYFKAGDYSQCKPCGHAGQYAEVHLSQLHTEHSGAVNNQ